MDFKQIKWNGDNPVGMMMSYTKICGNKNIGFRLMKCGDGKLRLIDFTNGQDAYEVSTVTEGKLMAQEIFEKYCQEIINNICK